ncbi:MAG: SAM-dependent methyltransferase [Microbacterium sp.]|jgi:SAM-dependent methyltransferase|uniref:class I SAM-dependent methyltransferase n=1 Tax=unclassified Microbacterium TaxID=2609290 RepID=UPI000DB2B35F|nr:class I SAM-dependent methyltransferase [Microbacterium sp.]PZU38961.1 MAG: SAM-dependent methyltransferase [Microbacterium sp.]
MTPRRSPTRGPVGQATRGTTGANRLRRNDRYLATLPTLRRAADPLVVDLGYGASGVTALELHARLRKHRPDVEVVGLEISPERVARASAQMERVRAGETTFAADARVSFGVGGFEIPLENGRRPTMIRAMNVLRQYNEGQVAAAWALSAARLAPGGLLVEGTCDELGRVGSWIDVDADGTPLRLTISLRLTGLETPGIVAERLPKALIHRNVAGERVHDVLAAMDRAWARAAPAGAFGARQRFIATVEGLKDDGMPVLGTRARWRLGELTLPWSAVAPR